MKDKAVVTRTKVGEGVTHRIVNLTAKQAVDVARGLIHGDSPHHVVRASDWRVSRQQPRVSLWINRDVFIEVTHVLR